VLQGCLNGARPADAHPALPVTPYYLARDARAVARYGVTSVHVHPRCPKGLETLEPLHVGDAVAAIHAEVPGMEVGVPAARWVQPDPKLRVDAVIAWGRLGAGKPDVIAVNVHDLGWREVCAAAYSLGIGLELGVWTTADAVTLRKVGVPPGTIRVVAEPTVSVVDQNIDKHGTRAVAEAYLAFLYTEEGQEIGIKHFYRPEDEAVLAKHPGAFADVQLFTLEDLAGDWRAAQKTHFADGGLFDQIYQAK